MKKFLLSILTALCLCFAACGSAETEVVIIPVDNSAASAQSEETPAEEVQNPETQDSENGENQAEIIQGEGAEPVQNQKPTDGSMLIGEISPEENWAEYGYAKILAPKTGLYNFEPVNSEGIDWEVYVLDEEFTDAERYIPQVYDPVVVGQGAANIEEGKIIYLYSSANSWTMIETPEGCVCRITFIK